MDQAHHAYAVRGGPPQRAVIPTPRPPVSESVLRASILRIEKVQGELGACGCPPDASHEVRVCDCAAGSCFDGTRCVGQ